MKVEEKFNSRSAKLIDVQYPSIRSGPRYECGMVVEFFTKPGDDNPRSLTVHLTPGDALAMAVDLIAHARMMVNAK